MGARAKVGSRFTAIDHQYPKQNVSDAIQAVAQSNGVVAIDVSSEIWSTMTFQDVCDWECSLARRRGAAPRTIFYITSDTVAPVEVMLKLDQLFQINAMLTGSVLDGCISAVLYCKDDYLRLDHTLNLTPTFLTQTLLPMLETELECPICFESLVGGADVEVDRRRRMPFECRHSLCHGCFARNDIVECPTCRCTRLTDFNGTMADVGRGPLQKKATKKMANMTRTERRARGRK
jgi:hypothetical protein